MVSHALMDKRGPHQVHVDVSKVGKSLCISTKSFSDSREKNTLSKTTRFTMTSDSTSNIPPLVSHGTKAGEVVDEMSDTKGG